MASFISNEDLAGLEPIQDYLLFSSLSDPSIKTTSDNSSATLCDQSAGERVRRVGFCPMAVMISRAPTGEKEALLKLGTGGRPRLALKTYSLDTPNFQKSTSKAWSKVLTSFSASVQPLLSPAGGDGVASFSPRSPVDVPSSSRSPPSTSTSSFSSPTSYESQRQKDDEAMFIPKSMSIKFPTLRRKPRGRSESNPDRRGILKSPERSLQTSSSSISSSPRSPSVAIPVQSPSQGPLSTSPKSLTVSQSAPVSGVSPLLTPAHLAHIQSIPIRPCCISCCKATDLGCRDEYEEKWSKSARRKRRADKKREAENQDEVSAKAPEVSTPTTSGSVAVTESGEEEEVPLVLGGVARAKVDDAHGKEESYEEEEEVDERGFSEEELEDQSSAPPSTTTTPLTSPSLTTPSLTSSPTIMEEDLPPEPTNTPVDVSTAQATTTPIVEVIPPSQKVKDEPKITSPAPAPAPARAPTRPPPPVRTHSNPSVTQASKEAAPKAKRKFSLSAFGNGLSSNLVEGAFSLSTGSPGRGFI